MIDALCAMLDEFGPGSLTVRTSDGLFSRPILPVADRQRSEFACVVEESWLCNYGYRELNATLTFSNELGWTHLAIRGKMHRSVNPHDILVAWSGLAARHFPDGPASRHIAAVRFTPESAELWDIASNTVRVRWMTPAGLCGEE